MGHSRGTASARLIYFDEAGTNPDDPVTVVAGVFAHPDVDWQAAYDYLDSLRAEVPSAIREGLIFHATELYSGGKLWDRDKYDKDVRWPILEKLFAGARLYNLPVAVAWVNDKPEEKWPKVSFKSYVRHSVTFLQCLKVANAIMHKKFPSEKATVTAEDRPEARQMLMSTQKILRTGNIPSKYMGARTISVRQNNRYAELHR